MNPGTNAELPNLFRFQNGTEVRSPDDWRRRRLELRDLIVEIGYGGLPPTPSSCHAEELHSATLSTPEGSRFISLRVNTGTERHFSFLLTLLVPPGEGPFPVVLNGDACWRYAPDQIAEDIIERGFILAQFNRVELAADVGSSDRASGLYRVYPEGSYGAVAAWAWGYHRCVDVLLGMKFVSGKEIAIVGHSRGGKAVLLAGATDERIALTSPNNSGAGGAGSYLWQGPQSEALADNIRGFPYWYGPRLKEFLGRETQLPFDQHFLKALIAPRALLTTEALGDLWANPTGTWQTHRAAREAYRFLNAQEQIGIWYREGEHSHSPADWKTFLDFMEWRFRGKKPTCPFDKNPYPELPKAFSWSAPVQ